MAAPLFRLAHPLVADSDAARDADGRVRDQQLAVVAWNEAEPGAQPWRIEDAVLDARLLEPRDEAPLNAAHPDPVAQHTNCHPTLRGGDERVADATADVIRAQDVRLEHDGLP